MSYSNVPLSSMPAGYQQTPGWPTGDLSGMDKYAYERLAHRSLEALELANRPGCDSKVIRETVALAREILDKQGRVPSDNYHELRKFLPDQWVGHLRSVHRESFALGALPREEDEAMFCLRREMVARALETLGWHFYRHRSGDSCLVLLSRAEALLPGDLQIVERATDLGVLVNANMTSRNLPEMAREQIALGHMRHCRQMIERALSFNFQIDRDMLIGEGVVPAHLGKAFNDTPETLASAWGAVSRLLYGSGRIALQISQSPVEAFFVPSDTSSASYDRRASFVVLARGYAGVLLDLLNLPRHPHELMKIIKDITFVDKNDPLPFLDDTDAVHKALSLLGDSYKQAARFDEREDFAQRHRRFGNTFANLAKEIERRQRAGRGANS